MNKAKLISLFLLVILNFSINSACATGTLTPDSSNVNNVGNSQVFLFSNFIPTEVFVNNSALDSSQYALSQEFGKVYIYGSVFSSEGKYDISLSSQSGTISTQIKIAKQAFIEYTTENIASFINGTSIDFSLPANRAGGEHAATGNSGTRKPIIVRSITADQLPNLFLKWPIMDVGQYTIDYWCPKFFVAASVKVVVKDSVGEYTFTGNVGGDGPLYKSLLDEDLEKQSFSFTGSDDEYVMIQAEEPRANFIVDSFKMIPATHNTKNLKITSTNYEITDDEIKNVLFNTTAAELKDNITVPSDCIYEISKTNETFSSGDTITVYKLFDSSIFKTYTISDIRFLVIGKYIVTDEAISDIPFNESKQVFIQNITHNALISLKIFDKNGEEKTNDIINDGDVLKGYFENSVVCNYMLCVISASDKKDITSSDYAIGENTIIVPYGENFTTFLSKIVVPEFAQLSHPYSKNPSATINNAFSLKVTAQDKTEKIYMINIEIGENANSKLTSTFYEVKNHIVKNVPINTSVSDFIAKLTASNGGIIHIYDMDMKPKTDGMILGNETIRLYPRYRYAGNVYFTYSVLVNPTFREEGAPVIIWSCPNNEKNPAPNTQFTYTANYRDGASFATKRIGYNGTNANAADNPTFKYTALEAGSFNIKFFASASIEGVAYQYNYTVSKNATPLKTSSCSVTNSGMVDIGAFEIASGDVLSLTAIASVPFVSAALFSKLEVYEVNSINSRILMDNKYEFDLNFNFVVDESSLTDGIIVMSENGNQMPVEFLYTGDSVLVTTRHSFENGVKYNLIVTDKLKKQGGDYISHSYVYPVSENLDDITVTAKMMYLDSNGDFLSDISSATKITLDLEIQSKKQDTVSVCIVQYQDNNVLNLNVISEELIADGLKNITRNIVPELGANKISVFLLGANQDLLTNTYYVIN